MCYSKSLQIYYLQIYYISSMFFLFDSQTINQYIYILTSYYIYVKLYIFIIRNCNNYKLEIIQPIIFLFLIICLSTKSITYFFILSNSFTRLQHFFVKSQQIYKKKCFSAYWLNFQLKISYFQIKTPRIVDIKTLKNLYLTIYRNI